MKLARFYLTFSVVFVAFLITAKVAHAQSGLMTYHGRVVLSNGSALASSLVTFRVQVRSPGNENCLLFEEDHILNMSFSNGVFALNIGTGTTTASSPAIPLSSVFSNKGSTISSLTCNSGSTYTPNSTDSRRLVISFNDGSGWQTLQVQYVNNVPFSLESKQVGGYEAANLLRVEGGTLSPLSPTQATELMSLISGTSSQYTRPNKLAGGNLPTTLNPNDTIRWDGTNWVTYQLAGTAGGTVTSITAGSALQADGVAGGSISSSGTLDLTNTGVTAGTYGNASQVPSFTVDAKGRITSVSNTSITTVPSFSGSLAGDVTGTQGATSVDRIRGRNVSSTAPTTGQVLKWDGSQWAPTADTDTDSGGTITSISTGTGLSGGPITSSGTISLSNTSVAAGSYGNANSVASFTVDAQGRLTAASNSSISIGDSNITGVAGSKVSGNISGNSAGFTGALVGDVTGAQGATSVEGIRGVSVTAAPSAAGQVLRFDGSNLVPRRLAFQDLYSPTTANAQFPTDCTSTQTLTYSAVTDRFECTNISLVNTTDVIGGDVTGSVATTTVTRIQSRAVAATAPTTGQVLTWNGTQWAPASATDFTGSLAGDVTGTQGATSVDRIRGRTVASTAPTTGQVLKWNGTQWAPDADTGGGTACGGYAHGRVWYSDSGCGCGGTGTRYWYQCWNGSTLTLQGGGYSCGTCY